MTQTGDEPPERPAARVVLLDARDRVLLFRGRREPGRRTLWFTPGGRLEPGETHEQAALRELREETGLTGLPLGPELWRRDRLGRVDGVRYRLRERLYLVRTAGGPIDTSGFTEEERRAIGEYRWWTVDELRTTTDLLAPVDLAARLAHVLEHGPPAEPALITA